jgi:hypothetical protein
MKLQPEIAIERARKCLGKTLVDVIDVILIAHDGNAAIELLDAIGFVFEGVVLVLAADSTSDSLVVELVESIEVWENVRENHGLVFRNRRDDLLQDLTGKRLVGVWICKSEATHEDAIDLGFDDLICPTVKILCAGSQLRRMKIIPL